MTGTLVIPPGQLEMYRREADQVAFFHRHTLVRRQSPFIDVRIVNRRNPLTEDTARIITDLFPGYRLEWLLGYDDHMTAEDLRRSFVDRSQSNNDASIQILDSALREVCSREGIPVPLLDDIPELWFLQAQLRDFADSLMWNYVIHRDHSHVWSYLDQISVKSDVKATSAKTAPESD